MNDPEKLEGRLAALELRVASLEQHLTVPKVANPGVSPHQEPLAVVRVEVTNKRYQPTNADAGEYQDHIWFDCAFRAQALSRPARSIKGVLEFCDLFGDVKFGIGYTIDEPLRPGGVFTASGIGFEYNQFQSPHQWMLTTDLANMTFRLRVNKVLYEDGAVESLP